MRHGRAAFLWSGPSSLGCLYHASFLLFILSAEEKMMGMMGEGEGASCRTEMPEGEQGQGMSGMA